MIYELRVYHCVPGRLPDLLKRFDTITLPLWEKHGIHQAGFWTTLVGESNQDLTYFLKWESLAEREAKMGKFGADPEWLAARAKTEEKLVGCRNEFATRWTIGPFASVSARWRCHSGSAWKMFHFFSRSASESHFSK